MKLFIDVLSLVIDTGPGKIDGYHKNVGTYDYLKVKIEQATYIRHRLYKTFIPNKPQKFHKLRIKASDICICKTEHTK